MLVEERFQFIINQVNSHNVVSVSDLSKSLGISEVTIRRDLKELEQQGVLRRTHGGATSVSFGGTSFEPSYFQLANERQNEKRAISEYAVNLIQDDSAIAIDGSSTCFSLCELISQKRWNNLTVVTNALRVAMELTKCDGVSIVIVGGQVRKNLISTFGYLADSVLAQLKVDTNFMGINGIDFDENSITTPNLSECAVKRSFMNTAYKTYYLADHTKFGMSYLSRVCQATEATAIITDAGIDERFVKQAEDLGVELLIAGK